jgi:hypothetical protein
MGVHLLLFAVGDRRTEWLVKVETPIDDLEAVAVDEQLEAGVPSSRSSVRFDSIMEEGGRPVHRENTGIHLGDS